MLFVKVSVLLRLDSEMSDAEKFWLFEIFSFAFTVRQFSWPHVAHAGRVRLSAFVTNVR